MQYWQLNACRCAHFKLVVLLVKLYFVVLILQIAVFLFMYFVELQAFFSS